METNIKNSENYLNSVSKKKSGFNAPENYFSDVEDRFSSFLYEDKIPKNITFKTPDAYFDNLENTVLNKALTTEKEVKVISLKQRILKLTPLAAAACIVFFLGLNSYVFNDTEDITFESLADNEIENWMNNNISLISENDLAITYSELEFDESDMTPNSISSDELEDYLSNDGNISLILENN
ncbi:MAG: hypothetical protein V3V28_00765 [Polaribacter sp.]|uniref:hypothetical protein n=1 Tax=Polaribacter sp. TaxID=1920175 RepID=UPI002F35EDF8